MAYTYMTDGEGKLALKCIAYCWCVGVGPEIAGRRVQWGLCMD